MQPTTNPAMEYRLLGPTGIKVSAIGFGPQMYMFGAKIPPHIEELTYQTLKKAFELGVNYIYTAEFYGAGLIETYIGNALQKIGVKREDFVISTKIFFGSVGGANSVGCSRKRLIEGTLNSLKRLQLDYVDIIIPARYDSETPLEEVCRATDWLIRNNKALYWGTSEWSAKQIAQAIALCEKLGLYKPVVEQPQYNMIHRERVECEHRELYEEFKYGLVVWSPLAGGILTGKYLKDPKAEGRVQEMDEHLKEGFYHWNEWFGPEKIEKTRAMFAEFEEIAKGLGGTVVQLALAWVLRNKDVSSIIAAYSRLEQVEENLKAIEVYRKMTPEIDERIEKLLGNKPKQPMDWKLRKPAAGRR